VTLSVDEAVLSVLASDSECGFACHTNVSADYIPIMYPQR